MGGCTLTGSRCIILSFLFCGVNELTEWSRRSTNRRSYLRFAPSTRGCTKTMVRILVALNSTYVNALTLVILSDFLSFENYYPSGWTATFGPASPTDSANEEELSSPASAIANHSSTSPLADTIAPNTYFESSASDNDDIGHSSMRGHAQPSMLHSYGRQSWPLRQSSALNAHYSPSPMTISPSALILPAGYHQSSYGGMPTSQARLAAISQLSPTLSPSLRPVGGSHFRAVHPNLMIGDGAWPRALPARAPRLA